MNAPATAIPPPPPPPSAEFMEWIARLRALFHHEAAIEHRLPFLQFHDWLTNPQPRIITQRRQNGDEVWYHRLADGVAGSAQSTYNAALYHAENLERLEQRAISFAAEMPLRLPPGGVSAITTPILDFEYQALTLAAARYFEHLTRGLNAYFKDGSYDFEKFGRALRHRGHPVAQAMADAYDSFRPRFEPGFSHGGEISNRSRMVHYEFVPAGIMNIGYDGHIFFVGGGDRINWPPPSMKANVKRLSDVIDERLTLMREYTTAIIDAFVKSERAWEVSEHSRG